MGLMFEGETIEEIYSEPHNKKKRKINSKYKPYIIIIAVIIVILALVLVWGLVIQKKYPNLKLSNLFGSDTVSTEVADETGAYSEWTVMERVSEKDIDGFVLQLPVGMELPEVAIENHYRDRALLIRLQGIRAADFAGAFVKGDVTDISVVAWKAKDNEILVSFQMTEVWEYEVVQDNGQLLIVNRKAAELYDTVVVIDPIYSADISEDVTALIGEVIAQKGAEEGVKVYLTRGNGGARSEAERLALIVEAEPDYVLELMVSSDTDTSKYGMSAVYNDDFYNPECTNAQVADIILVKVVEAAKNRAVTIESAGDDSLLQLVKLPAAGISVGYASNSKESLLLLDDGYRAVIAEGILAGIKELVQAEEKQ